MATRAHSTRTPLLLQATGVTPLFERGVGQQLGPVTVAIRAAQPNAKREIISHLPTDICDFRRRIAERIEADIALLDALDGDTELEEDDGDTEDNGDAEPSLCGLSVAWPSQGGDDRELENENDEDDFNDERDTAADWSGEGVHAFEYGGVFA